MVATPDTSESCRRKVAPLTIWVSNVNGTISFRASGVNGSKPSYTKHQGSPLVSMRSEKAASRRMIEFEYRENQLTVFLTEVHHPATRGLLECTGTNPGRLANCRRHHQIVPKVGRGYLVIRHAPLEKANDDSLRELHEKWLNSKRTR
jgi:hypothetical protein